ncbi:hypothetical protein KAJ27_22535 [bacterium]|nr:hypothetical protein [bacterium]
MEKQNNCRFISIDDLIPSFMNISGFETTNFIKAYATRIHLNAKFGNFSGNISVLGKANITSKQIKGNMIISSSFLKKYQFMSDIDRQSFLMFLEYKIIIACGSLLPLVLTGGTHSEAFFAGICLLGYDVQSKIELLARKDFVEFALENQQNPDFSAEDYWEKNSLVYDTDCWDFLTDEQVATIKSLYFDLSNKFISIIQLKEQI